MFWQAGVRSFSRELLYPLENASLWFERSVLFRVRTVLSYSRAAGELRKLRRENELLQMASLEAEQSQIEIRRLREALQFQAQQQQRALPAPVISRGGTTAAWQSLRVARGSFHGVRRGDPVVVPQGVAGRVVDVSPHTSEVLLITDPNSRVACELDLPSTEMGLVRGILYGGGARPGADPELSLLYVVDPLRLRYLNRDFEAAPRTRVITSGLGRTFPRGLLVGYLLDSRLEPNGLSREATVAPAVDMAALDIVFILTVPERSGPREE